MVKVYSSSLSGTINVPSNKSYTHRSIILSLLNDGKTIINNPNLCDDCKETISVLETLGVKFNYLDNALEVYPLNNVTKKDKLEVTINYSASTLRMILLLLFDYGSEIIIHSTDNLIKRGIDDFKDIFNDNHISYEIVKTDIILKGCISTKKLMIKNPKSSQSISGTLLYLTQHLDKELIVNGDIPSFAYFKLTCDLLNKVGYNVINKKGCYTLNKNNGDNFIFDIPSDYTNMSYYYLLRMLQPKVNYNIINSDIALPDQDLIGIMNYMKIKDIIINCNDYIDSCLTLMIWSSFYLGATFTNVERLTIKESNRLEGILKLLSALNINYSYLNNEIVIKSSKINLINKELLSYNDHRLSMLEVVLSSIYGANIDNIDCINKSDPEFINNMLKLGLKIERI